MIVAGLYYSLHNDFLNALHYKQIMKYIVPVYL